MSAKALPHTRHTAQGKARPEKGQTGARAENSVSWLMKVASMRNANRQGRE